MDESPAGASRIDSAAVRRPVAVALAAFVVGYNLSHHNGLIGSASAGVSDTRVADWVDLATPFVVLGPLLCCLGYLSPTRRWWVVAAIGCITYVEGHGIHLAANSISNVADPDGIAGDIVHLWDEVVGHYLWYVGLAIVVTACAASARRANLDLPTIPALVGGGACGITWATNALEGGTAMLSLILAATAVVVSLRDHRGLANALIGAGVVASAIISVYGLANSGFPQPSSR